MPADSPETLQAGALTDLNTHRVSVASGQVVPRYPDEKNAAEVTGSDRDGLMEREATLEELEGPNALRRVAAPIPLSVFTVAFVELCERFSYYGTQVVCMLAPNELDMQGNLETDFPQMPTSSTTHFLCPSQMDRLAPTTILVLEAGAPRVSPVL
jgi:hypothetical protein